MSNLLLSILQGFASTLLFWIWIEIMEKIERDALDALVLADEVSRRAIEFERQDLDEVDLVTQWATKILTHAGYQFDEDTGNWIREVIE